MYDVKNELKSISRNVALKGKKINGANGVKSRTMILEGCSRKWGSEEGKEWMWKIYIGRKIGQ